MRTRSSVCDRERVCVVRRVPLILGLGVLVSTLMGWGQANSQTVAPVLTRVITEADPMSGLGPTSYLPLAESMLENGRFDLAIELFSADLRRHPDSTISLYQRGLAHMLAGDQHAAVVDFTAVIELDPHHSNAFFNRALAHRASGSSSAALVDFDTALVIDPSMGQAYLERGLTHFADGARERALGDFTHATQLMPESSRKDIRQACMTMDGNDVEADWRAFCGSLVAHEVQ